MKFETLVQSLHGRPFFESREVEGLFDEPQGQVQARLSRWVAQEKLVRLRRGRYLLAEAYRRCQPSTYHISNYLLRPSYVSLHSALEFHALIPEAVAVVQAVTPLHGRRWRTPVGEFRYRSIRHDRFFGYRSYDSRREPVARGKVHETASPRRAPGNGQRAFLMAVPEKAILDFFYLSRGEWTTTRIVEMRFQNVDAIDVGVLRKLAAELDSPKVQRATKRLLKILGSAVSGG